MGCAWRFEGGFRKEGAHIRRMVVQEDGRWTIRHTWRQTLQSRDSDTGGSAGDPDGGEKLDEKYGREILQERGLGEKTRTGRVCEINNDDRMAVDSEKSEAKLPMIGDRWQS